MRGEESIELWDASNRPVPRRSSEYHPEADPPIHPSHPSARSMQTVPVFKPFLDLGEIAAAQASLERGWLGMGSDVAAFESTLARLVSGGER